MTRVTVRHSRLSRGSSLAMILLGLFAFLFLSGFVGLVIMCVGALMYWFYKRQMRRLPPSPSASST
jgi:hypothetical protein